MPRVACIGLGSIGQRHINNLIKLGYTDIIGMDVRPFPHETRFPVVDTMSAALEFKPTHALICSPPMYHYPHAFTMLKSGVHTFIEKPMTLDAIEARTLVQIEQENKPNLAVGYMERLHPTVQIAKVYAGNHEIDEAIIQCFWKREGKTYESSVEEESSHAIDLALYLFGPVVDVEKVYRGRSGRVCADLRHENGIRTEVDMDENAKPYRSIMLSGIDDHFDRSYGNVRAEWDLCYRQELAAFIMGEPVVTCRDGLAVMEVLEKIRRKL